MSEAIELAGKHGATLGWLDGCPAHIAYQTQTFMRPKLEAFYAAAVQRGRELEREELSKQEPSGYLPEYELDRLSSGHDARLRSAKFGPSVLDGDVPLYAKPIPRCKE